MKTNSSGKTSLLQIILIVVLIIVAGGAAFFYWQQQRQQAPAPFDISSEAVREKCLENTARMTDSQLADEVKNLKYPEEIDKVSGEKRITAAEKQIVKYFICKLQIDRDEELYNTAKEFIEGLTLQEEYESYREESLARLEKIYHSGDVADIIEVVAFGPIESVCSGEVPKKEFLELALNQLRGSDRSISTKEEEEIENRINNLCIVINKYKDDASSFIEKEITGDWSNNKNIIDLQMKMRIAAAFRLGGNQLALGVCDYVPRVEGVKESDCKATLDLLGSLKNFRDCKSSDLKREGDCSIYLGCNKLRKEVIDLICSVNVK
jgi:hypothetical protein